MVQPVGGSPEAHGGNQFNHEISNLLEQVSNKIGNEGLTEKNAPELNAMVEKGAKMLQEEHQTGSPEYKQMQSIAQELADAANGIHVDGPSIQAQIASLRTELGG